MAASQRYQGPMINFIIAARRKPEDTQERYFYEWGIVHVALMISTPQVMQLFKRYVQHYSVSGVTDDMLIHPLSPMAWDNMAEHLVESYDDFVASTRVADYVARMRPDRKSTRLNSSHIQKSRMPSSA